MTQHIYWVNYRVYSGKYIKTICNLVKDQMHGFLPIYGVERKNLENIATKYNLSRRQIYSIRSQLKIQGEIYAGGNRKKQLGIILESFDDLTMKLKTIDSVTKKHKLIRAFLKDANQSISYVITQIKKSQKYGKMLKNDRLYFENIIRIMGVNEIKSKNRGEQIENLLANFLDKLEIDYMTENDIRKLDLYKVTPDFLFNEDIEIQVNNIVHTVRWMDAKSFMLINTPFMVKSLAKQAKKYNEIFGKGAFVFSEGIDTSVKINSTVILDGSILVKK